MIPVHPIEAESFRILAERVDLGRWAPLSRAVVARVIHAAADVGYADTLVLDEAACAAGLAALEGGAPVVADVEMVAVATRRAGTRCLLDEGRAVQARHREAEPALTASAAGMRVAAERWPRGAIVVVGNAPTALAEVVRLAAAGRFQPALVIGLPVGFVGAAEAKAALRASGLPSISNVGERGGSAVAAAALNALWRLCGTEAPGPTRSPAGASEAVIAAPEAGQSAAGLAEVDAGAPEAGQSPTGVEVDALGARRWPSAVEVEVDAPGDPPPPPAGAGADRRDAASLIDDGQAGAR